MPCCCCCPPSPSAALPLASPCGPLPPAVHASRVARCAMGRRGAETYPGCRAGASGEGRGSGGGGGRAERGASGLRDRGGGGGDVMLGEVGGVAASRVVPKTSRPREWGPAGRARHGPVWQTCRAGLALLARDERLHVARDQADWRRYKTRKSTMRYCHTSWAPHVLQLRAMHAASNIRVALTTNSGFIKYPRRKRETPWGPLHSNQAKGAF
jgi:hypothetical protein